MKIIYPYSNGEIAITFELEGWDMHELARMTTPNGTPYLIVKDSDLPADWSTSAAWECDFSQPHGTGIGPHRWHIEQAGKRIEAAQAMLEMQFESEEVADAVAFSANAAISECQALIDRLQAELNQIEGVVQ